MSRVGICLLTVLFTLCATGAICQAVLDPAITYPLPQEAQTLAIGDLNGDGRDDLAVTAWPSALYVLYQQADGRLSSPLGLYAPTMPLGLCTGDIDGDWRVDLAVGGTGGAIFVYRQQNDGTFALPDICEGYGLVSSIAMADLNGDGFADIASTSSTAPVVLVSLQLPDGTFGLPEAYWIGGNNARCLSVFDCSSDTRPDLTLLTDDTLCYLTASSGGGFGPPQYISSPWAYALASGDVTGDGRDDLVFTVPANQPDAAIGVIPQTADGLFGSARYYPAYDYGQSLTVADIDADGRNDVVTAHAGYEAVTAFHQIDGGNLGQWVAYGAPYCNSYQPGSAVVGDLNSDGAPDVALTDWWNGVVVLLGKPTAQEPPPDTTSPSCTASIFGVPGQGSWYVSPVTVTLSATDNEGGSGVADVLFSADGTTWSSYAEPVVVSAEGATSIAFFAVDNASNKSAVQWIDASVDSQPPVVTLQPQVTEIWPPNGSTVSIPAALTAVDRTSGIAGLRLEVTDEYGLVHAQFDVTPGDVVAVPLVASRDQADIDGRTYTLTLVATDQAGNTARATATVKVPRSQPPKPKKVK